LKYQKKFPYVKLTQIAFQGFKKHITIMDKINGLLNFGNNFCHIYKTQKYGLVFYSVLVLCISKLWDITRLMFKIQVLQQTWVNYPLDPITISIQGNLITQKSSKIWLISHFFPIIS
jgi:SPX domain protein involved in polyphosphate accumulation